MTWREGGDQLRFNQLVGGPSLSISPEIPPSLRTHTLIDAIEPSRRVGPGPGDIGLVHAAS